MTTDVLIKVDDLQKQFKGGKIKALDGVSTDIHKGEVVVIRKIGRASCRERV